jgi:hypothetical protein
MYNTNSDNNYIEKENKISKVIIISQKQQRQTMLSVQGVVMRGMDER